MAVLDFRADDKHFCFGFDYSVEPELRGFADFERPVAIADRHDPLEVTHYYLSWDDGTPGQAVLLRNVFAAAGTGRAMNFIPAEGAEIVEVRFAGPIKIERRHDVYSISFELERVH